MGVGGLVNAVVDGGLVLESFEQGEVEGVEAVVDGEGEVVEVEG